jgi:hypothetical protein
VHFLSPWANADKAGMNFRVYCQSELNWLRDVKWLVPPAHMCDDGETDLDQDVTLEQGYR